MITLAVIKELNPCQDRLDNFVKYYGDKEFTKGQFMGLRNITQEDKLWVAFRLMPKANVKLAAADIAESVLYIWEKEYPNDKSPRKAIEAARKGDAYVAFFTSSDAHYSAHSSAAHAASAAANYAAYSAASSAHYSSSAAYSAAYFASLAAAHHAANKAVQDKLNRKIVLKYWK